MDTREMSIVTSKELEEILSVSVVSIKFLRKDGQERLIHCTTQVPATATEKAPKKRKPGLFVVWDVEKKEFRAFNFEQVLTVEVGVWSGS